jgi:hypothetical protein
MPIYLHLSYRHYEPINIIEEKIEPNIVLAFFKNRLRKIMGFFQAIFLKISQWSAGRTAGEDRTREEDGTFGAGDVVVPLFIQSNQGIAPMNRPRRGRSCQADTLEPHVLLRVLSRRMAGGSRLLVLAALLVLGAGGGRAQTLVSTTNPIFYLGSGNLTATGSVQVNGTGCRNIGGTNLTGGGIENSPLAEGWRREPTGCFSVGKFLAVNSVMDGGCL